MEEYELRDVYRKKKKVGVNKSWQWQNDLSDQTCDFQMPKEIVTTWLQHIREH